MFISPAYAQAAAPGGIAGGLESFLPLILIFVVFYFLLIRPQQKKAKQHRELLGALRRGDRVVTAGGIIGTITKIASDTEVIVEIAEGVRVRVMRGTILDVVSKTEPVSGGKDKGGEAEEAAADANAEKKPSGLGRLMGSKDKQ